jgi:hypothetical protein
MLSLGENGSCAFHLDAHVEIFLPFDLDILSDH